MKEYKNINEVFENWGKENQKLPEKNLLIKNEILSKVPFTIEGYRKAEQKRIPLPWLSMALATMAVLVVIGNMNISSIYPQRNGYITPTVIKEQGQILNENQESTVSKNIQNRTGINMPSFDTSALNAPSMSSGTNSIALPGMPSPYYPDQGLGTDTREFLKINYNGTIKTRNVNDTVSKVENIVRGSAGRVDSINGGEKYGYVSFSVPSSQFEMFKSQIKNITNAKLFIEETNSTNLLPEKQQIEKEQTQVEKNITDFKNQKVQLNSSHTQIIDSYNYRIYELNRENGLLQVEWQTATPARRIEITARLAQILQEKNNLEANISNENAIYRNKVSVINQNLKNAGVDLQNVQTRNQDLIDNVSMVSGTISVTWISLFELVGIFFSWYWIALILLIGAVISYWRYRMSMKIFI